jgi:hypothetical protein
MFFVFAVWMAFFLPDRVGSLLDPGFLSLAWHRRPHSTIANG